jgi:hypothetical protein
MTRQKRYIVPGALHIHTTCSDGSGSVPEVIAAARSAGLRWIVITDHDTLEGRSFEGWHGNLFVAFGHEITPPQSHFLAFDVDEVVNRDQPTQDYVDEVYERGGFGIIAHPDDRRPSPGHRWHDWSIDGPRQRNGQVMGLELWNLMSDWRTWRTKRNNYLFHLFPSLALRGPTSATLAWWDRLNMEGKRTFGIGGLDAHAFSKKMPWGRVKIFPYRWMFRTLNNYLLLDEPLAKDTAQARQQLFAAIKQGRSYFCNRLWGTAPALTFMASRNGEQWGIGDTVSLQGGPLTLQIAVGQRAEVRLVHNGAVLTSAVRTLQRDITAPGVYTNPIYVQA